MSAGMSIVDVLSYGPICAVDEDTGCLATVNGSYVNLWVPQGDGTYMNAECRSGHPNLYTLTGAQMIDLAEKCLREWLSPS